MAGAPRLKACLTFFSKLKLPGLAALAPPGRPGQTWYPYSFLAPLDANQPFLDSALRRIESLVKGLIDRGIPSERIALLGFSQGACLTLEFAARHPRRYGAGDRVDRRLDRPPGGPPAITSARWRGPPVFLGTSDPDPHVPLARVRETEAVLKRMSATVELRSYPGLPHTINDDELAVCRALLQGVITQKDSRE